MLALTEKQSFLNRYGLSGNALKIIACLFMLADHIGFVFFPSGLLLRKIGRLALPIFAFLVAEGCKYTKNKPKHLLIFLVAGIIYLFAYLVVEGVLYGSILTTFTLSTLIIYSLQFLKKYLAKGNFKMAVLGLLCIAASIIFSVFVCRTITVDYGIAGVFLPVFVSLPTSKITKTSKFHRKICTCANFSCSPAAYVLLSINAICSQASHLITFSRSSSLLSIRADEAMQT